MGKEGVLLLAHPFGERLTWILLGLQIQSLTAEAGGSHSRLGANVGGLCNAAFVEDHFFTGKGRGLAADVAEEGGEAVVVLLAPLLKGVVMALRTLHAGAEEELGDVFHLLLHFFDLTIPGNWGILIKITRGGDDFAHELIVRFVVGDAVANPRVEQITAARKGGLGALVAQEGAPLVGEVFGVVRAVEQAVDEGAALGGIIGGHEVLHFGCGGQAAGDVESDAADEGAVVSDVRRRHADGFQFREDEIIHKTTRGRQFVHRSAQGHGGAEGGHFALIADHHGDIAGKIKELHAAGFAGLGHRFFIGFIQCAFGNVAGAAVGVVSGDLELLRCFERHGELCGLDADAGHLGIGVLAIGHALANPASQISVVFGIWIKLLAAAVRELGGAFGQEQALLCRRWKHAASARLFDDVLIVFLRLKAEQ